MPEYSAINITQLILPSDDRKYPLRENSTLDWDRETLMRYFEGLKKNERAENPILPSSPETFTHFQI